MKNILEGLKIIEKYDASSDFCAEHDQVFCGSYDLPMTDEDKEKMDELGWFEDDDSWSHFT